jgi:hypothetical protein
MWFPHGLPFGGILSNTLFLSTTFSRTVDQEKRQMCRSIQMFLDQHEPEFNIIPGPDDIERCLNKKIEPKNMWACRLCVQHYVGKDNCRKHVKLAHLAKFQMQGDQLIYETIVHTAVCGRTFTMERLQELCQVPPLPPPPLVGVAISPVIDNEALVEPERIEMVDSTVIDLTKAGPEAIRRDQR